MTAAGYAVTITRVAQILGEDEDLLFGIACDMAPEDGCLNIYDIGGDLIVAFTPEGIDRLRERIALYKQSQLPS